MLERRAVITDANCILNCHKYNQVSNSRNWIGNLRKDKMEIFNFDSRSVQCQSQMKIGRLSLGGFPCDFIFKYSRNPSKDFLEMPATCRQSDNIEEKSTSFEEVFLKHEHNKSSNHDPLSFFERNLPE